MAKKLTNRWGAPATDKWGGPVRDKWGKRLDGEEDWRPRHGGGTHRATLRGLGDYLRGKAAREEAAEYAALRSQSGDVIAKIESIIGEEFAFMKSSGMLYEGITLSGIGPKNSGQMKNLIALYVSPHGGREAVIEQLAKWARSENSYIRHSIGRDYTADELLQAKIDVAAMGPLKEAALADSFWRPSAQSINGTSLYDLEKVLKHGATPVAIPADYARIRMAMLSGEAASKTPEENAPGLAA